MDHRARWRSGVLLGLVGGAIGVMFLSAGAALAYWATSDSSNPAAAAGATLSAPTGGAQVGTGTPGSVSISWNVPSYNPTSYTVYRCGPTVTTCTPTTAITSGGCSGVITTNMCTDTAGDLAPGKTYDYAVTATLDNWVSPASDAFAGSTTSASALSFTVQPGPGANIQAAGTGTFTVTVAIQDSHGNTVTSDNSDTVTLAIDNNPGSGVLSCTNPGDLTVTVVAGLADYTGCSITNVGTGYTLTASSDATPTLPAPTNANSFNITAGDPSQLVFTSSPVVGPPSSSANLGPLTVQLQDVNGNVATAAANVTVNLSGPAGSVFSATSGGSTTTAVTIGTGLSSVNFFYDDSNPGSPQITASAAGLTSANQTETIGADKLVITTAPFTHAASSTAIDGPVTVKLEDAAGNPVTTGITVNLSSNSLGTYEFSASNGGTTTTSVTITPGSSTVNFFYGDELAGTPTITAAGTGVTSATQQETITAGPAAGLTFTSVKSNGSPTTAPCTGTVGTSNFVCVVPGVSITSMSADVTLIDQFQNVVTNNSGSAITVNLSGALLLSPTALTIPNGSSTTSGSFSVTISLLTTITAQATVNSNNVLAKLRS